MTTQLIAGSAFTGVQHFIEGLFPKSIFPNVQTLWSGDGGIWAAIWETLYMTFWTALVGGLIGLIIGLLLILTGDKGLYPNRPLYFLLDKAVNIFRAMPFIILLVVVIPLSRVIVGTGTGPTATLVPLIVGTAPFFARQVQNALLTVDAGVIEAAQAIGLSPLQVVTRVYLREGLSELIRVFTLTLISIVGLTAMAGAIGGGGLGTLAISIGHARYQSDVIWVALIFIMLIVFFCQFVGDFFAKKTRH